VLASDLTDLSAFLKSRFDYDTGPYTPDGRDAAKPFLLKVDYTSTARTDQLPYNQLNSSSDSYLSVRVVGYSGGRRRIPTTT